MNRNDAHKALELILSHYDTGVVNDIAARDARQALELLATPTVLIRGKTLARTIWTATTDGDNCPLTTTVHATQLDACKRVRDDLDAAGHPFVVTDEASVPGAWETHMDGACIIEPHNIEVEA